HDAQLFVLEAAHLEHEAVRDVAWRANGPAARWPVRQQPATQLEGRRELRRASPADAGNRLELDVGCSGEAGQAVVAGERILREIDSRTAAGARTPQQRDELRRRQSAGAAQRQSFAWPVHDGQFADS